MKVHILDGIEDKHGDVRHPHVRRVAISRHRTVKNDASPRVVGYCGNDPDEKLTFIAQHNLWKREEQIVRDWVRELLKDERSSNEVGDLVGERQES